MKEKRKRGRLDNPKTIIDKEKSHLSERHATGDKSKTSAHCTKNISELNNPGQRWESNSRPSLHLFDHSSA